MDKTLVIGVGNILMGDDGIAHYIIDNLANLPVPKSVDIIFIGTDVWKVLPQLKYHHYSKIIVVDAINTHNEPGSVYFIPAFELQGHKQPYSLHDFTVFHILAMARLLKRTYLFGVEINTLEMGNKLSPTLKEKLPLFVKKLHKVLL